MRLIRNPTIVLMIFTFMLNILSFFKSIVIAFFYGTNVEYDIFVMAQFIPLLFSGLIMGSLQGSLIPILISSEEKFGEEQTLRIYKSISLMIIGSVLVLSILFVRYSGELLRSVPIGFETEHFELLISLSKVSIYILVTNCVISLLKNLYNARRHFAIPAIATIANCVASVLYIYLDPDKNMYTLCYSLLAGALVEIVVQAVCLRRLHVRYPRGFEFRNPEVKRALWMTVPLMMSATLGHASPLINQVMASNLYEGAISSLNYAEKLDSMLRQIFVITISTTMLSSFTTWVAQGNMSALKAKVNDIYRIYGYILLPLAVYIFHFSPYIVKLLFERGAFTETSTRYTSSVWSIYSIGLYIFLCSMILARMYNAIQDAKYQVLVSFIGLILSVGCNVVLMQHFGHNGLAVSTVITSAITTVLLYYFMTRKIGSILTRVTILDLMKIVGANASMFVTISILKDVFTPRGTIQLVIWIISTFVLCSIMILVMYRLWGVKLTLTTRSVFGERFGREA
ncbi:hypothetical protein FE784_09105 [Paenibacillus hemerocallicola]|uniref:Murein biosynthesis integral membrane protein MurJ n=1 Tax=Paenibacillus hemerocallicola TaxID=1172614 RepID=A0A5C4TCB8_9BACL|nr:lipid II flippase MurJ [Paenibacillus hemerocallicola]TNJ66713.1 hypothetical protein FE784_09105 [Paenibacillus hemerocallicola]